MTCQDHQVFSITSPRTMNSAIIDINDQLEFLLEYLEKDDSVVRNSEDEEIIPPEVEDPEYYNNSSQPLDLSLKKQSPRSESSQKDSHFQSYLSSSSSNMSSYSSEESNMSSSSSTSLLSQSFLCEQSFLHCLPFARSPTSNILMRDTPTINFSAAPLTRCSNCLTTTTSTWRKDSLGLVVCNACGVYYRVHQKKRPAEWGREGIARRTRKKRSK